MSGSNDRYWFQCFVIASYSSQLHKLKFSTNLLNLVLLVIKNMSKDIKIVLVEDGKGRNEFGGF